MLKPLDIEVLATYGLTVVGVDEVGMGPLAGPVCACALSLDTNKVDSINVGRVMVDDSKKISRSDRETLFPRIESACLIGLGWVEVWEIERMKNINHAGDLARKRAYYDLVVNRGVRPDAIISDFFQIGDKSVPCIAEAKADSKSFIVACASIVAKVSRDRLMMGLHFICPEYDWCNNVGYPTPKHFKGLLEHGVTDYHRKYLITPALLERAKMKHGKVAGGLIP